jgi:Tfp pilus assembly protein PilV
VARSWRDESGFGMLELLIAIVVLNIGLFALIGAFNASTIVVQRAGSVSSAATLADTQMELYRSLPNCQIYLDPTTFPVKDSGSAYQADTFAYAPGATFFDKSQLPLDPAAAWSTSATVAAANIAWKSSIPTACTTLGGAGTKAMNPTVVGPDGSQYTVYTYMTIVTLNAGDYTKRVTIVVKSPDGKMLARETSVFDPLLAK